MTPQYYSQFGEDKWIVENLKPERGIFLEVGGNNGILSSNTLHFENNGWKGVIVEPDPRTVEACRKNRNNPVIPVAIGNGPSLKPFYLHPDPTLSGFLRKELYLMFVPVFPLKEIISLPFMPDYKDHSGVDLLSIDTEGTELEVWDSIGDFRPKIVIVEYYTQGLPKNDVALVERFTKDGYVERHRTEANIIFERV